MTDFYNRLSPYFVSTPIIFMILFAEAKRRKTFAITNRRFETGIQRRFFNVSLSCSSKNKLAAIITNTGRILEHKFHENHFTIQDDHNLQVDNLDISFRFSVAVRLG